MADHLLDNKFPLGFENKGGVTVPSDISVGELSFKLEDYFGNRVKYNLVKSRPELDGKEIRDEQLQHLYVALSEFGWSIGKIAARDAWMFLAFKNEYSPVVDYLEGLLADDSVVPVELDEVAREYLGATGPIDGAKVAVTLIGAVQRAYEPGSKFDTCLTLKGEQGIGKSSCFKALASADWFVDTMQEKELDLKMAIHKGWIYELQELESTTGKRAEGKVKGLLSSSVDTFKRPYGFGLDDHPRRSIFVASVNRDDFLRDSTGNRRFLVVDLPHKSELGERINVERVERERDRIWKAAVLAYKAGRKPILTLMEEIQNAADNKAVTQENWCVGVLDQWFKLQYTNPEIRDCSHLPEGHFMIGEAMEAVKRGGHTATVQQVSDALKELGCTKHKHQTTIRGQRYRLWKAPEMERLSKEELEQANREVATF